jgi:hypothetical protein
MNVVDTEIYVVWVPERNTLRPQEYGSYIAQALAFFSVALCSLESSNAYSSLL